MGFNLADDYDALGEELLPKVIDPGTYTVEITKATAAQTGTGKQAIKLVLKVIEGPEVGTTIPDQMTWSPESPVAARIFSQSLAICGAEPGWIKNSRPSMEEIAARMVGSVVSIRTTIRQFNGQDQANVNYSRTISTMAQAPAEAPPTLGVALGATAPVQAQAPAQPLNTAPADPAAAQQAFAWPGTPAS